MGKTKTEKRDMRDTMKGLGLMLGAGAIAGMGLNIAFGTKVWNPEGVIGGLVSALLIYIIS
jgi:hypothetical protein